MRTAAFLLAVLLPGAEPAKDNAAKRYHIAANLEAFPQDKPKTALESVIRAIDRKQIDYLLAQLADPDYVDEQVRRESGDFDKVVKDTTKHFADDPTLIKYLRRILKNGEWDNGDKAASAYLKNNKEKRVYLRKIGDRWYLENRQQAKNKP
jgi:hypothetical protein